ncbi:MAG: hypothetical protein ACI9IP_001464 [Arcticibacterium sp.]|jgi:hypothetical protein
MNQGTRVAFCTDFSHNAKVGLDNLLFSIWSFEVGVDIIHLIEDNEEESLQNIKELRESLKHQEDHTGKIKILIFKPDEKDKLLDQLNLDKYNGVTLGLTGNGQGKGLGSFVRWVYAEVKNDVGVFPSNRFEKIDNRVTILLEKEHIDYLYLLRKYATYLQFNYCKLTIILKSSEPISDTETEVYKNRIMKIIPGLSYDVRFIQEAECSLLFLSLMEENKPDLLFLFSDDYFFDFSLKFLEQSSIRNKFDASLNRVFASPEKREQYKTFSEKADIMRLKEF